MCINLLLSLFRKQVILNISLNIFISGENFYHRCFAKGLKYAHIPSGDDDDDDDDDDDNDKLFCGMADRRKPFSLISSQDQCQRSSPSRISDTQRAGFEPVQNLSSGFVE